MTVYRFRWESQAYEREIEIFINYGRNATPDGRQTISQVSSLNGCSVNLVCPSQWLER